MTAMKFAALFVCLISLCLWIHFRFSSKHIFSDFEKQAFMDTLDIVRFYGFAGEEHVVISDNGYKLVLHRILPKIKRNITKGPVLLQHGLLQSSSEFVFLGPENSLAFLLVNSGYDVWLGNLRGNYYSNRHTNLSLYDKEYWDFSYHQMAIIDTAAVIGYITEHTQSNKLVYIGLSLGGAVVYGCLVDNPKCSDKVALVIGLAPAVYPLHVSSPAARGMLIGSSVMKKAFDFLGIYDVLYRRHWFAYFYKAFCTEEILPYNPCLKIMESYSGSYEKNINKTILPVVFGHMPAGTSLQTLAFVGQTMQGNGTLRPFDYENDNEKYYGTKSAPVYPCCNVTNKVVLFCGSKDRVITCEDVELLFTAMAETKEKTLFVLEDFTHLDFTYGNLARTQLYNGIVEIIDSTSYD